MNEFDADMDQYDDLGWCPLIYCIIHNNYEIAKLLIKYECDIEAVDFGCWSPSIFASILNNDKMLRLLGENNANLERFVYANKNPLIICAERGHHKCLKVLKDFDVDLFEDGLNIVKQSNHKEMTPSNRKKSIQVFTNKNS